MGEAKILTTTPAETRMVVILFTTGETSEIQQTMEKTKTCIPAMRERPSGLAWVVNPKMRGDVYIDRATSRPDVYNC